MTVADGPSTTTSSTSRTCLPRTLSPIETLGFGLSGLLLWLSVAPGAHAELGRQAIWVWIPGAVLGILINLQVRQLGQQFPDVAGGTPNYLTHLLPERRWLTSYAAIGYLLSWVAVIPVNAIILTNLIETYLPPLDITIPGIVLKLGFVLMAFVVAFSGNRSLSALHLAFLLPAVGLLLLFCIQGSVWLLIAAPPQSEIAAPSFSIQGWAKWYLNGTYAFYACETASVFVADSKQPRRTLQSLLVVAGLIPIVYLAGSWLLLHTLTDTANATDNFLTLLTVAKPYWGAATPLLITFLVVSSNLLCMATAVSIIPRILYQLAQDQYISSIFGRVSSQGVFGPGLGLTLLLSLVFLTWGDLHEIVMVTGVGWLIAFITLHWGIWSQREACGASLPSLALAMAVAETLILVVGGWAWGIQNFAIGLLLPLVIILGNYLMGDVASKWPSQWHWQGPGWQTDGNFENLIPIQIATLVGFISGATIISWSASAVITRTNIEQPIDFLVVLVLVLSFFGVAIACWTVFPKTVAVNDARKSAEALSQELEVTLQRLQQTQVQMIQQEKLSSLGALVAGVAHEINNPVSFIYGNLFHAQNYIQDLLTLVQLYQQHYPDPVDEIDTTIDSIELDFLKEDLPKILQSMNLGTERICEIVLSLRNFSRKDEATLKSVDIHDGLESTLALLQHRLKATSHRSEVRVIKHYGELPQVECYPSQLNQVFMNILANAIDAMDGVWEEAIEGELRASKVAIVPAQLTIFTRQVDGQSVEIEIADNGPGITAEVQARIFEPFFTTKPIGKGTGIGMSISYQIVTQNHQGQLRCQSGPDQGAQFIIQIPIQQAETQVNRSQMVETNAVSNPNLTLAEYP
ncbi:MAG: ATP-binding protein [Cyanobacteria bacterium P01_C01_bin.118]